MVDASTACRMNPMATLGMDRSNLMRESLHVHGGIVYPGLKTQEASAMPLGYVPDLHYKHDVSLENRKPTNGYIGLYKSPPPGLQKPLMVPGGDSLGLDIRVGPAEKQTDLGLNGGSSYLRLPWMSPYPDTGMYPFMDSSKYAALNMYKASFMSQPSPYLPQHLAYQSLCAGAGASAAGADRLFYMPPYPPVPLSAPLAPPMRIPGATVATTPLSPLVHCQDKSMQSIGPRVHHESSSFGQQLHQQQPPPHHHSHDDRLHSSKSSRISSSKGSGSSSSSSSSSSSACSSSTISSSCSSLSVDSTANLLMQSSRTASRQTQPLVPPPPPLLIENSLDFQKPLPRGTSSSSSSSPSVSHPFYMSSLALEHSSPARSSSHKSKSKDGSTDHHRGSGGERKSSKTPPKTTSDKCIQQVPTKDPADKPLDLSSKMDFGTPPNGFNHKLEVLAKLGHSPTTRYGLHPSQELKEAVSPPSSAVSTSSKPPERPEIISNLHSTWVVPSHGSASVLNVDSSQNKAPSVIKNKSLEQVTPQQRSSSCPRIGESNSSPPTNPTATIATSVGRPASASPPPPNLNGECPKTSPNLSEKSPTAGYVSSQPALGKSGKAPKRPESQEVTYKPQQPHLQNGHTSSHLYLSQNETFMAPGLPYGNRYLPYPGPDSMPLHHLPLPGKVPVYPHPVLLNSSSLYPARLTPKHNLPYGMPSSHGEFLTYHNSQEMVHPLMSPHITLDTKSSERLERRPKSQDKYRHNEDTAYMTCHTTEGFDATRRPEKESENVACQTSKLQTKPQATVKEKIVCVDLIQSNTDGGGFERHGDLLANKGDPTRPVSSRNGGSSDRKEQQLLSNQAASQSPAEPDKRAEISGKLKLQGQGCLPLSVCQDDASPVSSHGVESPAEKSPLLDLPEHQTLRCARTSGDRTSEESSHKSERQGTELCNELNKHGPEETESHEDDDDSHSSSKTRRSSLAKRIANSSGYVGDRFKCITTELYADSSKLSREQRALQMEGLSQEDTNIKQSAAYWERAMLRFSELELKEKEGGAAASRELAGGQHGQAVWEGSQRSTRPEGTALSNEPGKEGLRPVSENNKVPVVQRCVAQNQSQPPREREQGWANREARVKERTREGGAVASQEPAGRPLTAEEKPLEDVSLGTMPSRKRPHQREEAQAQAHQGDEEEEGAVLREKRSKQVTALQTSPLTPVHVERTGSSCPDTGVKRPSLQCHKRLSDKRQRLKEQQRAGGWRSPSTDREGDEGMGAELTPRLRRPGDSDKPKGKRQCKTKHISLRERRRASQTEEDCQDADPSLEHKVTPKQSSRKRSESLSDISNCSPVKARPHSPCPIDTESPFPQPPSQPSPHAIGNPLVETPPSRPMPPEARRLIVNKNAGETLLQRAARLGYEEVVLYCLENKVCDINHRDNAGYCALHEACARGWLSIVQHLVEHGADINCSAQDGTRPIHDAVENDHLDVVRLLLSYGADPTLATYSGRGLLKMTHSDVMECFLIDYFADLEGREDDDPRLYWELYGSSVCEPPEDLAAFDVLANPPSPGNDDEQQQQQQREVFEFEFSDRPLLPCYNIQVSLSQGPRNWLLLSDVLKRLKMSARDFRTNFAHIEVVSIPEAEFYKQASLSQFFCPEELEGFLPDSKEPLDLVEISRELVALLGSCLECLDDRWDPLSLTRS